MTSTDTPQGTSSTSLVHSTAAPGRTQRAQRRTSRPRGEPPGRRAPWWRCPPACLTFTPDTLPAPPVVPSFVFMTDVDAEQALVASDPITADGLWLRAGGHRDTRS
ncbi:hypothetical protein DY245_05935 [Streptomyces inhibens]|uniref:Uncharacterized protein n=1 Tax=Streptomyces inhibens TaxID=2293571 RepID=A0A371Q8W9_STRIH|nr:hypothetical protein DY245_05935 [Streptomyces inhibens]